MKNKFLLLCLVAMFTNMLYAGDSTNVKSFKRLYFGVSFTPLVSYRYLTGTGTTGRFGNGIEDRIWRNSHESPEFGFMVGARLGVNFNRWMSFETGVDYLRYRYSYNSGNFRLDASYIPLGYDTVSTNNYGEIMKNFHYLNIPVQFNFMPGKRKLK
ncbi:MAG: hypothetical protein V4615_14845, partial [Bacteroidota bacterium]